MAIVAEIMKQSDIATADDKAMIFLEAVVYDDTDPLKTPLGQPISIQFDRDGFMNTEKGDAKRKAAIAKIVNEQAGARIAEYQKTATLARSMVGQVIPLTASSEGEKA